MSSKSDLSRYRSACDSMVAMGSRTQRENPIFAKNSDRPAAECQPLLQVAAQRHGAGSKLRCQYIEIEQAPATHAFLGSRPHWLWGVEHGLNDCGVAIGNHTIFTRDPVAEVGLCGMDLVRLGLERGGTAEEALGAIVELIEGHGQGGSGFEDVAWPYHSSFLIADHKEAWLLEASASHWVAKRASQAERGLSASNHTTIGQDWDRIGEGTEAHARDRGWWQPAAKASNREAVRDPAAQRFDFARSYRDAQTIPAFISSGRYATTCAALAKKGEKLDLAQVMRVMRDHYESGDVFQPGLAAPDHEKYFSVCEHADPVGTTTASLVVELVEPEAVPVYHAALASPCTGIYLPLFPDAQLPEVLLCGGREDASDSAWWLFKRLLTAVEVDFAQHGPRVREAWRPLELELEAEARELQNRFHAKRDAPEYLAAAEGMMHRHWGLVEAQAKALLQELKAT